MARVKHQNGRFTCDCIRPCHGLWVQQIPEQDRSRVVYNAPVRWPAVEPQPDLEPVIKETVSEPVAPVSRNTRWTEGEDRWLLQNAKTIMLDSLKRDMSVSAAHQAVADALGEQNMSCIKQTAASVKTRTGDKWRLMGAPSQDWLNGAKTEEGVEGDECNGNGNGTIDCNITSYETRVTIS